MSERARSRDQQRSSKLPNAARRPSFRLALLAMLAGPTAFGLLAPRAQALNWQDGPAVLRQLPHSSHRILVYPTTRESTTAPRSLSLYSHGQLSFDEAIHALLGNELSSPLVAIQAAAPATVNGFALDTGSHSTDYSFSVGGMPLCDFQVRAHQLADGSSFVLGAVPDIDPNETAPSDWPDVDLAIDQAAQSVKSLSKVGEGAALRLGKQTRCVYVSNGKLMPVWQMTVYANEAPYKVTADGYETFSVEQSYFDATSTSGTASAFPRNTISDTVQQVVLNNLVGDGTLHNSYLQTVVPASYTQSNQPNEIFTFPQTDQRFSEVQAFVHANVHFSWFQGLGFQWYGPQPLQLKIHVAPNGVPNNALFTPGSSADGTLPNIQIDNGDGVTLQNLVLDGDVVSHEFGHHVIYKTLQTTSGESLVLHEGLADSFVFFRTGDPCLGRSICPTSSSACMVAGQCLRTAQTTLSYQDTQWTEWAGPENILGHLHGQLISGLLWDLRSKNLMSATDVTNLTFKAISYFQVASGFCDFVGSLYTADKELFNGANTEHLNTVVTGRGLQSFLPTASPNCTTLEASSPLSGAVPASSGGGGGKTKTWWKCGVVGAGQLPLSGLGVLGLLLLPLLATLLPQRQTAPARAPRPKQNRSK